MTNASVMTYVKEYVIVQIVNKFHNDSTDCKQIYNCKRL